MYEHTLQGHPRNKNAVEGWHRSFQASVGGCHPNFWKFIDILKREQNLAQVHTDQVGYTDLCTDSLKKCIEFGGKGYCI